MTEASEHFEIELSNDGRYLIVTGSGDTTREIAAAGTRMAHERATELGVNCVLIDVTRSRNVESTMENVRFTRVDAPPIMPEHLCFAVLVAPGDHSHDFHVAFARSQGIDISLFWERDRAIEHLDRAAARFAAEDS